MIILDIMNNTYTKKDVISFATKMIKQFSSKMVMVYFYATQRNNNPTIIV
jgi:hypothetical protein